MRIAVVTGVSRGLGQAMLPLAIDRFDRVVAIGRRLPSGFTKAPNLEFVEVDFSGQYDWRSMLAPHIRLGEFDQLTFFDNASIFAISAVGQPEFQGKLAEAMQINLITPAAIASALIEMCSLARARLLIVHITTGAARRAIAGWGAYCITKAAATMLQEVIIADYPDVQMLRLDPGSMDTDMQAIIRADSEIPVGQQEFFRKLKNEGQLVTAAAAAERIFDHLEIY